MLYSIISIIKDAIMIAGDQGNRGWENLHDSSFPPS